MKKTIKDINIAECTGCAACVNVCPNNAIQMIDNSEGFQYPVIQEAQCVECGVCYDRCPAVRYDIQERKAECYAMWAEDDIRLISSSGGMFTLLAESVLNKDGYVCGAAWGTHFTLEHIIIHHKKEITRLRGSKYVQSSIGTIYRKIKELLDEGKEVLFSGCPCQVAGIKKYLNKEYETLYTIDLVCHGAPSPKAFVQYLNGVSQGREIKKIDFRNKKIHGWGTPIDIEFTDGSCYTNDCYHDPWYKGFLNGVTTRLSCGSCKYAGMNRIGDITLGDFWGIGKIDKNLDDRKGTSLVIINTKKGRDIFLRVKSKFKKLAQFDTETVYKIALSSNGQLISPKKEFYDRSRFFKLLRIMPFDRAIDYTLHRKFDVGIVGWWYNDNYGGCLTYYALHQVVNKMGLSVLMISKPRIDETKTLDYNTISCRFAKKHYEISKTYHPDRLGKLNDNCNTFLSGSDQLFNYWLWEYSGPSYYLDFAAPNKNIVSYASSFGNGYNAPAWFSNKIGYWLRRFDALSVREDYAVDICRDYFGIKAEKVLDPVFLCDTQEYDKLIEDVHLKRENNYMLSFFLDPNEEKRQAILKLSKKLKKKYVNLVHASNIENNMKCLNLDNTKGNVDIEEWLFYYKNADFIITDSFHGTCFAIIFKKPFISVANMQRGEKRFVSILSELGLMDRLIYNIEDAWNKNELILPIDYEKVYEKLNKKKEHSYNWLKNALMHPSIKSKDDFKLLDIKVNELVNKIIRLQDLVNKQMQEIEKLKNNK